MWETGSYRRRNIGIGSIAFAVGNLVARPCFAMELRGSARPTLGKELYHMRREDVAKRLRCQLLGSR